MPFSSAISVTASNATYLPRPPGPAIARRLVVTTLPRILIIEDDVAIRGMLTAALGREALLVDTAADGVAALEKLATTAYAVIIVDLMMPRMDGYAFLEAFRGLTFATPPLIFVMTAYDDVALLKLDATLVHGYLKKPFDLEAVVHLVRDAAEVLHTKGEQPAITPDDPPSANVVRDVP